MWQALPRQEITPIRLRKPEAFHEFYTPYRPDWSQSVSANACFTIAFNTVVKDKILPLNPQLAAATGFQQEKTMLRHGQDAKHPARPCPSSIHHLEASQAVAGMTPQARISRACCTFLLTDSVDKNKLMVISTQTEPHFFSLFAYLSAFADFRVTGAQPLVTQMRGQTPAPLSCLKWGINGELSAHDTALLVNRLASSEKSRRAFKEHFERRQRSSASDRT